MHNLNGLIHLKQQVVILIKNKGVKKNYIFVGAIYQFTHNNDQSRVNQSQLGLLTSLQSQEDLDSFRKNPILVAPPGLKDFVYDESLLLDDYLGRGWELHSVGTARDKIFNTGDFEARRWQCGLKHCINSTVNVSMGVHFLQLLQKSLKMILIINYGIKIKQLLF